MYQISPFIRSFIFTIIIILLLLLLPVELLRQFLSCQLLLNKVLSLQFFLLLSHQLFLLSSLLFLFLLLMKLLQKGHDATLLQSLLLKLTTALLLFMLFQSSQSHSLTLTLTFHLKMAIELILALFFQVGLFFFPPLVFQVVIQRGRLHQDRGRTIDCIHCCC
ncbi:hypothetical protein BC941DRAFT_424454 [Chlamydoabsidia padenii]|nr:hypothetical protein BC941DRAFT_424454 [Chlamydoabsidia padenii]